MTGKMPTSKRNKPMVNKKQVTPSHDIDKWDNNLLGLKQGVRRIITNWRIRIGRQKDLGGRHLLRAIIHPSPKRFVHKKRVNRTVRTSADTISSSTQGLLHPN